MLFPTPICYLLVILYCSGLAIALHSRNQVYEGSNTTVESRGLDEIYTAAQKELGDLVVLWGGDGMFSISCRLKKRDSNFRII